MKIKLFVSLIVLGSFLSSCSEKKEQVTEVQSPYNTSIPLALLMEHVVTPAAYGVWGASGVIINESGEHERAPKTEERWEEVINYAATLLESSNLLLLPGRAVDERWAGYVAPFTKVAEKALVAAETHDAQAISEVGDELVVVCGACHVAYGLPENL